MSEDLNALEAIVVGSVAVTARALQRAGVELTLVQWRVMVVLQAAGVPMPVRAVAGAIGSSGSAVSRQLARLSARGLVQARRSGLDRRERLVSLTRPGIDLVARVVRERDAELAAIRIEASDAAAVQRLGAAFVELAGPERRA